MGCLSTAQLSATEHWLIKGLMRVLFNPVFGWKDRETHAVQRHCINGFDDSTLSLAVAPAAHETPKGIVLLCHPFSKYGMSYFLRKKYHEHFISAGYHVVAFNFKGFGASTLKGISFADDVACVAAWARARFPNLPLHLFGASFGAYHGIHCIAKHRAQFVSAVFDSVPTRITAFFNRGFSGALLRWISTSRWARVTGTHSIFESLPLVGSLPCLFLYGRADPLISPSEITRVSVACKNATIRVYENCGHLEILKHHPMDYINTMLGFVELHSAAGTQQPIKDYA